MKITYQILEFSVCIIVGILAIASYEKEPVASAILMAISVWLAFKGEMK